MVSIIDAGNMKLKESGMSTNNKHDDDVIDIEEYGKRGEPPPKGRRYKVRIDRETFIFDKEEVTGRELLTAAGKIPVEQFMLHQRKHNDLHEVGLDEVVDLTCPGIERFITHARDATEGLSLRQDFSLPSDDRAYLEEKGLKYETVIENNVRRLVIYDFNVGEGYNHSKVDLYLRIEPGYPDAQIDMVYYHPGLQRKDGKTIGALSAEQFDGKSWQRWSRHRTRANPWRPGLDNVSTHLAQVRDWLKRELEK